MVSTIRSSPREMDRIGAGYALGTDAAHGDAQVRILQFIRMIF